MENEKEKEKVKQPAKPPLKPEHPNTEGAPDDKNPDAQYEDKDES